MEDFTPPDVTFKTGHPGTARYGNFINYYQFHPPENRLTLLPEHIWTAGNSEKPFYGLDVGSNSGNLTVVLYKFLKEKVGYCNILGVDIDPKLVERSKEKLENDDIQFHCVDFMKENSRILIKNYLQERKIQKFDAVFCFSTTMWIHLNNGDDGLRYFLKQICNFGDLIVLEPQPWKCYKSAVKRMQLCVSEFPLFKELKMRENVEDAIENFMTHECGTTKIYESEPTKWGRKILFFKTSADS